ncbi:hypothetical protein F889_00684 [Acinetobacter colistiniresistens]|uniref:DUF2147 domain-containing protein n=1 Tax=Acinetobacter colistiniresistens TaxID=280145 RepID=N9RBK8_9GAMM|nr:MULTISPECIES: DUF2147 domain-containing protein [Acinetobacter]ENX35985.1 hypothetical protein F889_00684 [Acinetobacter colistiniresistens]EPG42562.1 hypothetical protein F907_00186 [Acinetobacter colistiniresistens]TVT75765.1 DUF2147 domain-containing protein [Acinetobacter colistiniresistens]
MKKIALAFGLLGLTTFANAADALNGSVWQTIDDETKQPKAIVKFTEQKDGTLTASIQKYLVADQENACSKCEGTYHNKPLKGLTIVHGLKNVGGTSYDNGSIIDPKNGKTYRLKAEILEGGKKLKLRGYIGVAALGRNQTWIRAN